MKFYNPFKPHKVQMASGQFALRCLTLFGWRYHDLVSSDRRWPRDSRWFKDCLTHNESYIDSILYAKSGKDLGTYKPVDNKF